MEEKELSDLDQIITDMNRTIPSLLWNFYQSLMKEGFSEEQAMTLTIAELQILFKK